MLGDARHVGVISTKFELLIRTAEIELLRKAASC
jgi:hypothetical protein